MTADEAIEILDPEYRNLYSSFDDVLRNRERINEACKMGMIAIKILKQSPLYLCYHQNNNSLASEVEQFTDHKILANKDDVIQWVKRSIEDAIQYGFKIDEENPINSTTIEEKIQEGSFDLTMFFERQENWNCSFDIIVREIFLEDIT